MRYRALATDYDGTLAHHGTVSDETFEALRAVRRSQRLVLLVTGREMPDLRKVCPTLDVFDLIVAENGALLYTPATGAERLLCEPPPAVFVETLRERGVTPISVGRGIVATWEPHERTVFETIHDLGLELHVIFNKGAVMVLPSGVNKASGLQAALATLGLSGEDAVGIGDAENDHTFLAMCRCAVAVANALPQLKARADVTMQGKASEGVRELIAALLEDDLARFEPQLKRRGQPAGALESTSSRQP